MNGGKQKLHLVEDLAELPICSYAEIEAVLKARLQVGSNQWTRLGPSVILSLGGAGLQLNSGLKEGDYGALESYYKCTDRSASLEPHPWAFAASAHNDMILSGQDQAIVLSGVSGSGKSLTAQSLISYFLATCAPSTRTQSPLLLSRIRQSASILAAFGNARRPSSVNSSRFGVYTELQFSSAGALLGLQYVPYYFEKGRAIGCGSGGAFQGEANFHIFYYLIAGAASQERTEWKLADLSKFAILRSSATKGQSSEQSAKMDELKASMKSFGFNAKVQRSIFQLIAAILHLGNLEFTDSPDRNQEPAAVKNLELLDHVANLLGVDPFHLQNALTYRTKQVKQEVCTVFLDSSSAAQVRDSFATTIYSLLFSWILEYTNARLASASASNFVGIVDLIGFEQNRPDGSCCPGLDSLFINYANERLNDFYQQSLVDRHLSNLSTEGISVSLEGLSDPYRPSASSLIHSTDLPSVLSVLHAQCSLESAAADSVTDTDLVLALNKAFSSEKGYFIPQPPNPRRFGINHFCSPTTYDASQFISRTRDSLGADIIALIKGSSEAKGSTNSFLAGLFNDSSITTQAAAKRGIVDAKQNLAPKRTPSTKRRKGPGLSVSVKTEISKTIAVTFPTLIKDLIGCLDDKHCRFIPHIAPSPNRSDSEWDSAAVTAQLAGLKVQSLLQLLKLGYYYHADFEQFTTDFNPLLPANTAAEKDGVLGSRDTTNAVLDQVRVPSSYFVLGKGQIFLNFAAWNLLVDALAEAPLNPVFSLVNLGALMANSETLPVLSENGNPNSPFDNDQIEMAHWNGVGDALSDNMLALGGDPESFGAKGINDPDLKQQQGLVKAAPPAPVDEPPPPLSKSRRFWVAFTTMTTFWIPTFTLRWSGMSNPTVQQAWREKVALCFLIAMLSATMLFYIIGFTRILCPPQKVLNAQEVANSPDGSAIVIVHGSIYDLTNFAPSHAPPTAIYSYSKMDATALFPLDRCNLSPASAAAIQANCALVYCHTQAYMFSTLDQYFDSNYGYTRAAVSLGNQLNNALIIVNNNVYNVTLLLNGNSLSPDGQAAVMTPPWGTDKSSLFKYSQASADLNCLQDFQIGVIDNRDSANCQAAEYILIGSTGVVVAVMVFKFLAALQLGSKREPEDLDKFVILQVPCYTEGEESLRKTIDSLSVLKYDDKRKLLFIICDGMIIGSGNDRPTPRIVLDILGVDPELDPEPQAFLSIGEGNKQLNMGKVYSGLYECSGHRVPFVVITKVGKASERSRPGNRGKRDSQMILMNFLSKVHFDSAMTPMELEIYHNIKNVIGVDPSYYEYVLMVDADTEVLPDSLNRMVSCMLHDTKIMGICGETEISNEKDTWITMIQVYEYYISHHLAKAFESLFGSVTCLPGCFCMYRIRTPTKQSPLIIYPEILKDYSENNLDTLHKKNLLALGEDRYLTTLMLKYFPDRRLTFTPDAMCKTVAPDRFNVLLSQRRRWINSTIHNLFELLALPQLCGFCCFSMRFVVFLDLIATLVMPATVAYLVYLIVTAIQSNSAPLISLILIGAVYGMQIIIFVLKRQWQHIGWMIIYIFAMPIFSFGIPLYSYWHFDDFSWGNTRRVVGERGKGGHLGDDEKFDPASVPLKKWKEFEQDAQWDKASSSGSSNHSRHSSRSAKTVQSARSALTATTARTGFSNVTFHDSRPGKFGTPSTRRQMYGELPRAASSERLGTPKRPTGQRLEYGQRLGDRTASHDSMANLLSSRAGSDNDLAYRGPPSRSASANSFAVYDPMGVPRPALAMTPQQIGPSEDEIAAQIRSMLSGADLTTVTKKQIRDELSYMFNIDMTPRRELINNVIDMILQGRL